MIYIEKLLEEAWRVFQNWNGIERWKLGELVSTATIAALREERGGAKPFPPRKNSQNPAAKPGWALTNVQYAKRRDTGNEIAHRKGEMEGQWLQN